MDDQRRGQLAGWEFIVGDTVRIVAGHFVGEQGEIVQRWSGSSGNAYDVQVTPDVVLFKQNPADLELLADQEKNCGLSDAQIRKMQPVGSIVTGYFPDALRAVAAVAYVGNEKHNPGEPLHWARGKSDDHLECDVRHLQDHYRLPSPWDVTTLKDGREFAVLHLAEHAWRALALLQLAVEAQDGEVIRVLKLP